MYEPTILGAAILGLLLGSFGNVLVSRLPRRQSIGGRSQCPHCGAALRRYDLVPVLSYLVLRGRCRSCRVRISLRYPLLEIASAAVFVIATSAASPPEGIILAFALWLLLLIAVADAETHLIPDALAVPFILAAVLWSFLAGTFSTIPALIGGGFFALQWVLSRGRWVGSGDIGLGLGLGFLAGSVTNIFLALGVAYVVGAIVASGLLLLGRKKRSDAVAFAPFLAAGGFIVVFFGEVLLKVLNL